MLCSDEKTTTELSPAAAPTIDPSSNGPLRDQKSDHHDPPPDGGLTAWLVVFSCFLFNFNLLGLTYAFGVYQAHYSLDVFPEVSTELISLIGSICTALTLASGIPAGRAIELYGYRTVAVIGSIISVGSLVAAGFCRTVPTLIGTQGVLNGIGCGTLFIPANAAPAQWFLKRRSISIGIASAGSGVGGIFWSFVLRVLISKLGYQWALWLSACISACIYAIALCFLKTKPMPPGSKHTSLWGSLVMFKDPKFVTLYCASALSVFGYMVPFFYVPTYAETQLQSSSTVGAALSAIMDLGMVVGRIVLGLGADSRLGNMNTVISGMALAGISQLVLWLPAAHSLPLLYVFAFAYGLLGGGYIGLLPAVLAHIFDSDKLPAITGLFFTSELPGQLAGGPIAGVILASVHGHSSWTPVILYSGLTLFGGSLFAVATRFQVDRRVFATV